MVQQWGADSARREDTAVVACLSFWDYSLVAHTPGSDAYKATGRCFSVAAGRISYTHAFKGAQRGLHVKSECSGRLPPTEGMQLLCCAGPAISIDTACSSSLSGTALLAGMLQRRKCMRGLLTAALVTLDPATIGMLAAANMLAPDGRCKTLDAAADGCASAP